MFSATSQYYLLNYYHRIGRNEDISTSRVTPVSGNVSYQLERSQQVDPTSNI